MATVDVLQKKSGVVEKVNKLLDSKERRANYVEKQRDECLAFDKKPKKNWSKLFSDIIHTNDEPAMIQ